MNTNPYTYWTTLTDRELTIDKVQQVLASIEDDLWAAAACTDRVVDDIEVQRTLLQLGIARTQGAVDRSRDASTFFDEWREPGDGAHNSKKTPICDTLAAHFRAIPHDAQLCSLRATLLQRLDRLNTFVEICKEDSISVDTEAEEEIEDDPWGDGETGSLSATNDVSIQPPFPLPTFLTDDLVSIACQLGSCQHFSALQILLQRHGSFLWPYRFTILESISEHVPPSEYREILPAFDVSSNSEQFNPAIIWLPWRSEEDWSEIAEVRATLNEALPSFQSSFTFPINSIPYNNHITADELSVWYKTRADNIINATGFVDNGLTIIQFGASHGIPGLDELGEELSLLSRLIYDAPQKLDSMNDWTLDRWRSMEPSAIVQAYLAHSTPDSLPKDIAHLVLPYLFVLESHAERAGKVNPQLSTNLLYEYITSAPLEMAASIFEASKPTLPLPQRLIRDDEDMARLALACLYGSDSLDQWSIMNRIFECLPAWDLNIGEDNDEDIADTTIHSLGAFVAPSTTHPHCNAFDLLVFFKPLPLQSLSRVLDILDVHLESGEILARWSVPAPLRWFLQSHSDITEQRAWANRMARQTGGSDDPLNTQEDWEWLLEDMLKLTGKGSTAFAGAFGLLTREEVIQLFFSGLLSSGKFGIAQNLLRSGKLLLDSNKVEKICLSCSREFYDNSQSGNYTFGDMKLAYDCLGVPYPTENILQEKEFIEATSRITSFNITTRPGIPISPLEIRLTKDRLSLVSRVLSSNSDAYKHMDVILDLVHKLGFRDDVTAEVKTLAMLADTALQAEDFLRAYELSERMVETTIKLRDSSILNPIDPKATEAYEVCWVACFQLGRQSEFTDVDKKLLLLGHALTFCPPEKLHEVLTAWRRLEKENIRTRESSSYKQSEVAAAIPHERSTIVSSNVASSLRARLQGFHMPSPPLLNTPDAAALASRTFRSVAANFPFGYRTHSQTSDRDERYISGTLAREDDVSTHATRVISKGIGWLIGTEDES